MENKSFNVLVWDFNSDSLEQYDVLPYLRRCYKDRVDRFNKHSKEEDFNPDNEYYKVPKTLEDFKEFIKKESMYQFWARCEYEMICHGWPMRKKEYKLDVHDQILMNIDVISDILWEEINHENV